MEAKREKVKKARLGSRGMSAFVHALCLASRTLLIMKAVGTS